MKDVPPFDLYGTLGVSTRATRGEIEAAFRAAAKRHHPDTSADSVDATSRMQRLNDARYWLTDPERRLRYDQIRGVGTPSVAIPEVDQLGAWPDARASASSVHARPSSVMPAIAAIALMVLLTTVVVGIGSSYLTVAAFALALVLFAFAGLLTVLGWLR